MGKVTCISGIDTDIGKTVVTGLLAKTLYQNGSSVITQKIAQTGCHGLSEDIVQHRKIMEIELLPEDKAGLTCPYVFQKACSPHLAAELENKSIDPKKITKATQTLTHKFDHVLLEGVGGLLVPLNREITFLDYIQKQKYPLILVTSPRLGSINHTLSALEIAKTRGLTVNGIVYNCYERYDETIKEDSRKIFLQALRQYDYPTQVIDLKTIESNCSNEKELSRLLQLIK